jgi:hypothetical protein
MTSKASSLHELSRGGILIGCVRTGQIASFENDSMARRTRIAVMMSDPTSVADTGVARRPNQRPNWFVSIPIRLDKSTGLPTA